MRNGTDFDVDGILAKMRHGVKRNPSRNKAFEGMEIPMNPAVFGPAGRALSEAGVVKKLHVSIA